MRGSCDAAGTERGIGALMAMCVTSIASQMQAYRLGISASRGDERRAIHGADLNALGGRRRSGGYFW